MFRTRVSLFTYSFRTCLCSTRSDSFTTSARALAHRRIPSCLVAIYTRYCSYTNLLQIQSAGNMSKTTPKHIQINDTSVTGSLVAGCDLGKSTAKFVIGELETGDTAGQFHVLHSEVIVHDGRPMDAFKEWYTRMEVHRCKALGATGLHAEELISPVVSGLPEDACLSTALSDSREIEGPVTLIRVGARGYSVLSRNTEGHMQYLENDKCSSGTGETMVKIAGRFGLSIEQADELARSADDAIAITARCSVFAKSEMTHFGNQGKPADALFKGYFNSVGHYVSALVKRVELEGPVMMIGGCSKNQSLVNAIAEYCGEKVSVPVHPEVFEASGAGILAGQQFLAGAGDLLPVDPQEITQSKQARFRKLDGSAEFKDKVTRLMSTPIPEGAELQPSVLSLDIGSTGAKAVLTSIETGEMVLDLYDRTQGNPVGAASRLITTLLSETNPDVRAIALTGSGREAAATVMRAAYPDLASLILVQNEIVAHGTAAIRCDSNSGKSLSVVEIGGQDAKFIQIVGGRIVESDMNMACSAGTGSFLEEQGVFFGIDKVEEFTQLAEQSKAPPELGQMCTVFVAEAAAEASNEGFSKEELFGGFQYAVINNYINRVMGQRTFGERIFFQGKPATGPALAWTLASVTGREVIVPPNPGAMGAWGIALVAIDEYGAENLLQSGSFDLQAINGARIIATSDFQCRDKRCATLCSIEKTIVDVEGTEHTVYAGGACPKYEISTTAAPKLPIEAPSAFDEREKLLAPFLKKTEGKKTVGVPVVGTCVGYVPWLITFVRELGFGVTPLTSRGDSLSNGEGLCYTYDACAPVKIAHGVLDADVGTVIYPKILTLGDRDGCSGVTCVMEQGAPEMIKESLHARSRPIEVVHPPLSFGSGLDSFSLLRQAYVLTRQLGGPRHRIRAAFRKAAQAQEEYEQGLSDIGQRTIDFGNENNLPVVVVSGSLHVIHDKIINAGIPKLLRINGVLTMPMDCFPIPQSVDPIPRIHWAELKREMRMGLAAREMGNVYPLLISSFGCGPNSFSEQIFAKLMEGYPYTTLESDGHGGTAGYVTRVQAFLHTVRQHDSQPDPAPERSIKYLHPVPTIPAEKVKKEARLMMGPIADRYSNLNAARLRSEGYEVIATGPTEPDALPLGRKDCSGKECLVYQSIWGSFRKGLEENPTNKKTLLMTAGAGEGMCRLCLFSIKDQISLESRGLDQVSLANIRGKPKGIKDAMASFREHWAATLVWDLLNQMVGYHRPLERIEGECDAIYDRYCDKAEHLVGHPPKREDGGLDGKKLIEDLKAIAVRASEDFAAIGRNATEDPARRTVLLSGDFYTNLDRSLNDDIVKRLNQRGLHVIVESMNAMMEYIATDRITDLFGFPKAFVPNKLIRINMARLRHDFYGAVQKLHPWLPTGDMKNILEHSEKILTKYPVGAARKTLGSISYYFQEGCIDGVAVINAWGCDHGQLSEGFLRHQTDIPMMHLYLDGSPIDERKLNAFAFSLRHRPSRLAENVG